MFKVNLNRGWDFHEVDEKMQFWVRNPKTEKVDLPHDYIITKERSAEALGSAPNGYFAHGEGVYQKNLEIDASWRDKVILLDIDGAYMNAEITLNRELLALHPYGYTPFQVELNPALRFDGRKNELKIVTQSRQPSTRWYSGGGLYRSVSLWIGEAVSIHPWDVFVKTPEVHTDQASVEFDLVISNRSTQTAQTKLVIRILDAAGSCVAEQEHTVMAGIGETDASAKLIVTNPSLWDIDNPYLYTYEVLVAADGKTDQSTGSFGIRSISVDAENGFMLNGRSIKMKGGCVHHDNGLLGACAYQKAEERKVQILKSVGYNAIRSSHYPPSTEMLEACDRQGILLLDECFDAWRMAKRPLDYHLYFEDWWERDIEYMVKRDRNHPCVVSYSIGNEIGERDGHGEGAKWAKRLHDKFKSLDSTRPTMSALCGIFGEEEDEGSNFDANMQKDEKDIWGEATKEYLAPLDIAGYNYLLDRYEKDHERFPNRVIVASETHAINTYDYWQGVVKHPYVIGDFIWAAVDYLGEVGVGKVYWKRDEEEMTFMTDYPWRTSWQSDILLTGKRRPQSYFREIMWEHTNETFLFTTHPSHTGDESYGTGWHWQDVSSSWTFEPSDYGTGVKVEAYGPGDEAEFILNGKSLGRAPYEKLIATMEIPYEEGTLEAVTYKDGKEISRGCLITAGEAERIVLTPEETDLKADGNDLCYIHVSVIDKEGRTNPNYTGELKVSLPESCELLAIGSGDPCTEDWIGKDTCHAYQGEAVVIIKTSQAGAIEVTVSGDNVTQESCTITAQS